MMKLSEIKGIIKSEEARQISNEYVSPEAVKVLEPIFNAIRKEAHSGRTSLVWDKELSVDIAIPVVSTLESLGYKVKVSPVEVCENFDSNPLGFMFKAVYKIPDLSISWR